MTACACAPTQPRRDHERSDPEKATRAAAVLMHGDVIYPMPAFGSLFRYMWSNEPTIIRVSSLAKHVETLQVK